MIKITVLRKFTEYLLRCHYVPIKYVIHFLFTFPWNMWHWDGCFSHQHKVSSPGSEQLSFCKTGLWAAVYVPYWLTKCFTYCAHSSYYNENKTIVSPQPFFFICCLFFYLNTTFKGHLHLFWAKLTFCKRVTCRDQWTHIWSCVHSLLHP